MEALTYKIATLNINGIYSATKPRMLEDFIRINDFDILCLQVTNPHVTKINNYTAHVNIGLERRGTAILIKECYNLTDVKYMQSGRGISGIFQNIKIVNIYARSGIGIKHER
jgi:exonuclease III